MIREATTDDISGVVSIYGKILKLEAAGKVSTGWKENVYPTEQTALDAAEKNELFVLEEDGRILAAAKINREQMPEYAHCQWADQASDSEVMVLHTLVVDPDFSGYGIGKRFVRFYEEFAEKSNCRYLRMDTNEKNAAARALYQKLGYSERGVIPCAFNGIEGVQLVCLEKKLG